MDMRRFFPLLRQRKNGSFIFIGVKDNDLVLFFKDAGDGVIGREGVGDPCQPLEIKGAEEQNDKSDSENAAKTKAERRERISRNFENRFLCFLHEAVEKKDQGRENKEHAEHAEEHALRKDQADIFADFEAHEDQHQKAHKGGEPAARDRGKCSLKRPPHGFLRVT